MKVKVSAWWVDESRTKNLKYFKISFLVLEIWEWMSRRHYYRDDNTSSFVSFMFIIPALAKPKWSSYLALKTKYIKGISQK